jgi:hypothetical protein
LCELTTWRSWSFICKGGWYGLFLLLEITIVSVLFGLNFTSHVFCDISKAFDRVWHKGLIHKLKQSGISGNLLKWFQNYLYGREQGVYGLFLLLEITIVSVLFGLNFTSHFSDQRCNWLRSWFRKKAVSLGLSTMRYKLILTTCQSGFTKRDSAVNQLINITNDFGKALDSGKEVRIVFCDISKAFDRVRVWAINNHPLFPPIEIVLKPLE